MGDKKRNYEATLVLDTRGSNESADSMISKMSEIIASLNGEVKKVDNLGSRTLARPQNKDLPDAVYVKINFEISPEGPAAIKEKLRLDKSVDRILIEQV
ncbi:MAG: 30S ribosomal protein S6 [Opitutae bacterium]|jgi:small subunit ribosomal protein S6|nr:30S ribosomal protein S6 [Opitutae bacterium]|tara:strand:+ start:8487 stop:8783 length:297 start_codon:yes stop_codon:yes gene_type:complete